MHHVAFHYLMFTSLVFFVNLHENEFVFCLTCGREKSAWVFQFGFKYSCVGKQGLTLKFILGFKIK